MPASPSTALCGDLTRWSASRRCLAPSYPQDMVTQEFPPAPKTAAHQHVCFLGKTRKKKLLEYDSMVEERKSDPSSVWGPHHPQTKQQQHKPWCGRRALEGAQMDSRCAFCTGNSLSSTHVHLENKQAIKGRRQKKKYFPQVWTPLSASKMKKAQRVRSLSGWRLATEVSSHVLPGVSTRPFSKVN